MPSNLASNYNSLVSYKQDDSACGLTSLQYSYWINEQKAYRFHTVPFLYFCFFTKDIDVDRLALAVEKIIEDYPELSVEFLQEGKQRLARRASNHKISLEVSRLDRYSSSVDVLELQSTRKKEVESKLKLLGEYTQFTVFLDQALDGYYVHFAFKLISFDALSVRVFYNALVRNYNGENFFVSDRADFKEFIEKRTQLKASGVFQRSFNYWADRISSLCNMPELPVVDFERMPKESVFNRVRLVYSKEQALVLQEQARKLGISISLLICTAYTDVLRLWSRNKSFTINMLMSHRPSGDVRFQNAFGNFGSTLLLECAEANGSFLERAKVLQRQLAKDMRHSRVEGVDIIRMMGTGSGLPVMPIVFASSLGLDISEELLLPNEFGLENMGGGLHTPQVWLDCQAYMYLDELIINWDYVEGVFLPGVMEDMFDAFGAQIEKIMGSNEPQDLYFLPEVPEKSLVARKSANQTAFELPRGRLEHFVKDSYIRYPEQIAIYSDEGNVTYKDLWVWSAHLAVKLKNCGIQRNDLVAVIADRSWRQIAALLGVLQSGAAYLPITGEQPQSRKEWLVSRPKVKVVLIDSQSESVATPEGIELICLRDVFSVTPPKQENLELVEDDTDLAYVIFTSGSTGEPKGVAIDHRGAVNTIQDIIRRFELTPEDRVIGLSNFNFDLSVYDIFGALAAGASLVLPPYSTTPAPDQWASCVLRHGVSVWNTVPASMEMLLEFLGSKSEIYLKSLRLVMLSGDWIPVTLPDRLRDSAPSARLVSLGGATEASIWSNYYQVDKVSKDWKSIPYGWPLSNQSFHVLTQDLSPSPDWVPGDLYIGGIGLAKEYYADPVRTNESFIFHPETGERLYKTGDVGRYFDNGCLEFLGRLDSQVKIRGFRIELEEIDASLSRFPGVRLATTVVLKNGNDSRLIAFYQPIAAALDAEQIRSHLSEGLPSYMVPSQIVALESLPKTSNGKVDRKALSKMASELEFGSKVIRQPTTKTEERLSVIWCKLLNIDVVSIDDGFFDLGGTSLLAVRLINDIEKEFSKRLPLASLLQGGTILSQAATLDMSSIEKSPRSVLVKMREAGPVTMVLVHPVGGNILCYRELLELIPKDITVLGIQSLGDSSDRSLEGMAALYLSAVSEHLLKASSISILGWSMGGVIAQEMARQIESYAVVEGLKSVIMIDSWMSAVAGEESVNLSGEDLLANFFRDLLSGKEVPALDFAILANLEEPELIDIVINRLSELGSVHLSHDELLSLLREYQANYSALLQHKPKLIKTPVRLYRGNHNMRFPFLTPFDLPKNEAFEAIQWAGDHFSIIQSESLRKILSDGLLF